MANLFPCKEVMSAVRAEFRLDNRCMKESLQSLRSWLSMQPHLPHVIDDARLERWLIRCKNSIEKTKVSIDMYFTLRNALPEILCNRDPRSSWFQNISNIGYGCPLPRLTSDNSRVMVMGCLDPDPEKLIMNDMLKLQFMIQDIRMCEDYCASDIYIMDFTNFTVGHVTRVTLPIIKKMEVCAMKGFNMRIKEIHLVNLPAFAEVLVNLVKNVLKPKIATRIHIHTKNLSLLHDKISTKVLPTELGGEAGPIMEHWYAWLKKVDSYRDWFLEQDKFKSDESKRPGKAVNSEDLFGFEGSFRKLNVD